MTFWLRSFSFSILSMYSDCKIKDAPQCWVTTGVDISGQDQAEYDRVKGSHNMFLLSGLVLHPLAPLHQ